MSIGNVFCGLECDLGKSSDAYKLFHFLDSIPNHYYFKVVDAAVWSNGSRIDILERFFPSHFQVLIQKNVWAERLVLHLYPDTVEPVEIDYYEDYLNSNCEMIILVYDVCYLEIYCKNQEWLQKLYEIADNIPGTKVDKKYEDTDSRTMMYV